MLRIFKQYYPIQNIFFVVGEGLITFASVLFAAWLILGMGSFGLDKLLFLKILLIIFICQLCLYYNDLYDLKVTDTLLELGIRLFQALGAAAIILAVIYLVFPDLIIGQGIFVVSVAIIIVLIISWRICYARILNSGIFNQRIIVLGSGEFAHDIVNEIKDKKDCGYTVEVMAADTHHDYGDDSYKSMILKKGYNGLCDLAKDLDITKIIIAMEEKRGAFPVRELLKCRVDGIDILEGNSFYEMLTGKLIVGQINPSWLIFSDGFRKSVVRRFLKRTVDIVLSSVMLALLLPLIIFIVLLIKMDSKGPVFFSQERVGAGRKTYRVLKFRSMITDAEKDSGPVWADDEDPRITRVGRFIRKWRIDEIPQLINVLKGEMSFVGPRPEREFFVKQLEETIPYYGERFTVKPGITGWAQVCYGYGASEEDAVEKLNYDLFYIKNMSILMDLMIVLRTIKIVLFGKGAR